MVNKMIDFEYILDWGNTNKLSDDELIVYKMSMSGENNPFFKAVKRNPDKVRSLLRAIARNVATAVDISVLEKDVKLHENIEVSRPTIYDYLETLDRLMIIEDQPAWNTHIRSSASLRKSSKRHFSDVSLAIAALGIGKKALLDDLKYTGFLFESMAVHDLRVYAQAHDAKVYHYKYYHHPSPYYMFYLQFHHFLYLILMLRNDNQMFLNI
jgi:predicted AAA+ superfamily ATPase